MSIDPASWAVPNGSPANAAADASPVTTSSISKSPARPGLTSRAPHRMPHALTRLITATATTIAAA